MDDMLPAYVSCTIHYKYKPTHRVNYTQTHTCHNNNNNNDCLYYCFVRAGVHAATYRRLRACTKVHANKPIVRVCVPSSGPVAETAHYICARHRCTHAHTTQTHIKARANVSIPNDK